MPRSTVITNPATDLDRLIGGGKRNRCACCGGPTRRCLDGRGDIMLCSRCARFCTVKDGIFTHVIRRASTEVGPTHLVGRSQGSKLRVGEML
jgi:hypothetical protein